MINSNSLTPELAEKIAGEVISFQIAADAGKELKKIMINSLEESLIKEDKKLAHDALFNARDKSLAPYEKKFKAMLKRIWAEEERILIANIKKMKKAWLHKDKVDDILYSSAIFEKKLTNGATDIAIEVMTAEGKRVVSIYDFDMVFDVQNPEVTKWLKSYMPIFSEKLEAVSAKKLRASLIEGIEAGEGVPGLANRVYEIYKDWGFTRAETIAQNQVIRASSRAALNVYRQSGVVKKKIWITYFDERTCPHCEMMDGKVIGIETNFFDLGDESIAKVDGKEQILKMNYEEIEGPPLHARCRCAVGAVVD